MQRIIVDTDIGSDPDDFFALLLLLRLGKNIDLVITGDEYNNKRATLARRILNLAGKSEVPVVQGPDLGRKNFHADALIQGCNYSFSKDPLAAIETICEEADEILYLGLQGFTNLAQILFKRPDLKEKLNIFQMGGALGFSRGEDWVEHNIKIDPESARFVLNSGARISLVQTATTEASEAYRLHFAHPLYNALHKSNDVLEYMLARHCTLFYEKKGRYTYMGDPLTVTAALGYNFVSFDEKSLFLNEDNQLQEGEGHLLRISKRESKSEMFMSFIETLLCSERKV